MRRITSSTVCAAAILTGLSAVAAAPAHAQTQPLPPIHYTLDRNGVDLVTGDLNLVTSEVSIGPPGAGGLTYGRVAIDNGWRDLGIGGLHCTGNNCLVSLGGVSEAFERIIFVTNPVFIPVSGYGSDLSYDPVTELYKYTGSDGTSATLVPVAGTNPYEANVALLTRTVAPNGLETTYHYTTVTTPSGPAQRLQSITNTLGYQIHYRYSGSPLVVDKVMGINTAEAYCAPTAANCDSLTGWPSVTYSTVSDGIGGTNEYATDQSNRTTLYHRNSDGRIDRVRLPGQTVDQLTLGWAELHGAERVVQATGASGNWTYQYDLSVPPAGPQMVVTASGPSGEQTVVTTNLEVGQPERVRQLVSNSPAQERTYDFFYDNQARLRGILQPEGNRVDYTLDDRGNVTETVWTSKDGLSSISTSATYPLSCTDPVICNRPTSTTDGRGNVTNYSWDPIHGGLLAVTQPAPTSGAARPETRYSYAPRYAWYKNSSGTVVQAPSAVTVPVAVSACITGTVTSGCAGTAQEVVTVMTYDTSGAATNLQPIEVSTGAATGSPRPTQTFTYTEDGDVETVTQTVSGEAPNYVYDTTTYVYDNARQLVGVMSADPDGTGPGLNRAQRMTYSLRGQVTLVEAGTTVGQAPGNFSSFSPLQRQAVTYDDLGRTTQVRAQTAGLVTEALQQVSYDASGRPVCSAVRMNPVQFASPPASACTASALGGFGPDRIATTSYSLADQPVSSTTAVGTPAAQTETVTYTDNGQPRTLTDGRGNVSEMEYDGFDRLARIRYPDPSTGQPSPTDDELYGYDANGNVTTVTTRANQTFTTTYDTLNRRTAVAAPTTSLDTTFTYDNLGRTLSASVPGLTTTMTWDALGRLTSETGPTGTMSYAYDIGGRRTSQTWPGSSTPFTASWGYNVLGEMTTISGPSGVIASYVYDDLGRRASMSRANGVSTTYAYDGVSRLTGLTHGGAANVALSFTHNPAGQIATRTVSNPTFAWAPPATTTTYTLDRLNRVASANGAPVTYDANGNLTHDGTRSYAYDAANRLTGGGSPTGSLTYDALGRLDVLTGAYGGRYVYDGVEAVAFADPSTNAIQNHFIRGPGVDEIVANYPTASITAPLFWLLDEQNSLMGAANLSGAMVFTNGYDDYGQPRPGNLGRFQYTGQLLMPDFGAYHYKARAYSPTLGRFLQTDPIGYAAGANLYGYVGGDPVNWVDPLGLQRAPSGDGGGYQDCWWPGSGPMGSTPITCRDPVNFPSAISLTFGNFDPFTTSLAQSGGGGGSAGIPSSPPSNLPGGPYTPAGAGQQPGTFFGPRQPAGGRTIVRWVPPEGRGGPPGSRGYWKLQRPGQVGWDRFNQRGQAISPQQAHPGPREIIGASTRGGPIVAGIVTFFVTLFWPTPAQ